MTDVEQEEADFYFWDILPIRIVRMIIRRFKETIFPPEEYFGEINEDESILYQLRKNAKQ